MIINHYHKKNKEDSICSTKLNRDVIKLKEVNN